MKRNRRTKNMNPRKKLKLETDLVEGMHRLREERATRDLQTLERLIEEQDHAIRNFICPITKLLPHEEAFSYVRRLQECIIQIFENLNQMRAKRASIHIWTAEGGESEQE